MSEQPSDDMKCYTCGRQLPDTSDPRDFAFDGYCDQDCVDGKTGIHTVFKLAELYGFDGDILEACGHIKKTCGVCFSVHKDIGGVSVSGSAEECPEHRLRFPFHADDFYAAINECEAEAVTQQSEAKGLLDL